jgi:uncharacterized protein YaaN involved in tellurite resistance
MTDASLDLSTPTSASASTPGTAIVAAPAVQSDLVLTPPTAVPDIGPAQAISMMPVDAARSAELADKAKAFLAGTTGLDPNSPAFIAKVNDVASMGQDDIRAAAAVSNEMLQRPVAALAAAKGAGDDGDAQRQVADTLVKLRLQVEDLDPSKAEGGIGHALLNLLPFRNEIRSYFAKYQSAQTQLNKIITSLQDGEDGLLKDNASIEGEKANLWATMQKLQEYAVLTGALDSQLVEQIATIRETDAAKADALTSDLLFTVRQKHQDLLTQLAVSAQGYLALDVVRKNNVELIKGVERATTTTVSALRTAVIVAQALANQKLVLDQITALNTTTSNLIVATSQMLKTQSAAISEQASSTTISMTALDTAFQNIYDTMNALDTYKAQAVVTMGQTVTALQQHINDAQAYLTRAHQEDPQADASGTSASAS